MDVVTGGAGFIGSHLVDRLVEEGRRVRVIDNFATGTAQNIEHHRGKAYFEFIEADIADKAAIAGAFDDAERIFHLAARADIVPSIEAPEAYFQSNVVGTFNVLDGAVAADVKRFVYVASSSCYGLPDVFPTPEKQKIDAQYPYALTKFLGEETVMHWSRVYKLPAISLRFFNVYGPRARTTGTYGAVFGVFLAQLRAGQPLTIVGDGTQTRDFTYVTDVVDALLTAAASDRTGEIYNVGSGNTYSVNRLVELLGAKETVNIPKRPGEPDCTWGDTARIREHLNWRPKVSFEEGVRRMLEHIDHWRGAPVWTPESIDVATRSWFRYLGDQGSDAAGILNSRSGENGKT